MSTKLKPITDTSWLVLGDTDDIKVGLLTKVRDQYTLMLKGIKKQFISQADVNEFFRENVFDNIVEKETAIKKKNFYVNGFPVEFENPNEVLLAGNDLPLFSKKESSEVYYSAGYYCLDFPKNWMPAFCPKLSTLETYTYAGPFKTEMEMRTALTNLRRASKKQ